VAATCPRCEKPLVTAKLVMGVQYVCEACTSCGGVLVDSPALGAALQRQGVSLPALVQQAPPPETTANALACPRCAVKGEARKMARVHAVGSDFDVCSACTGAWLDGDEVKKLHGVVTAPPSKQGELVGVFEMFWDCAYCDTKALLGKTNRYCPSCGAPQDPTKRYFPPPGKEVAANSDYEGADRVCPACSTPNGARANNCRQCGSPLDGSARVKLVGDQLDGRAAPPPPPPGGGPPAPPKRKLWPWALGAVAVLGCGFLTVAMLWTKDVVATVEGHQWSRTIDVERLQAVNDESWCDQMPSDAYSVSRHREKRDTRKVPDGQDCHTRDVDRGDGTFERRQECTTRYREEPIYDDRCRYTVDRWRTARTLRKQGARPEDPPVWPEVQLANGERQGPRKESYLVRFGMPEGKTSECSFKEPKWRSFTAGAKVKAKARVLTGGMDCSSL